MQHVIFPSSPSALRSEQGGVTMKQDQETLGRYLKRERETRHVTAEEIALFNGVKKSLVEALEADDFDRFPLHSKCHQLVKQYTAYLKLNQTEVLRRFEEQWRKSGSVTRYPKLTQFADGNFPLGKRMGFKKKKMFARHSPVRIRWWSFVVGLLIAVPLFFYYLTDRNLEVTLPEPSPPSIIEEKAASAEERVLPSALDAGIGGGAPKRASAIDTASSPAVLSGGQPSSLSTVGGIIGNRDTKRYHLPGMKYYDKVKAYHRVIFQSEREAIRAGYVKARE
jgi:cytoskeletal protein RodZ